MWKNSKTGCPVYSDSETGDPSELVHVKSGAGFPTLIVLAVELLSHADNRIAAIIKIIFRVILIFFIFALYDLFGIFQYLIQIKIRNYSATLEGDDKKNG
jgi:hypothetical protein